MHSSSHEHISHLIDEHLDRLKWNNLIDNIRKGNCTPFLGAGACCCSKLPLGSELAQIWAKLYDYPFDNCSSLPEVAQYIAVKEELRFPKESISDSFRIICQRSPLNFDLDNEPHRALADLALPLYLTTNYDGFMEGAIRSRHRSPRRMLCSWGEHLQKVDDQTRLLSEARKSIQKGDKLTPTFSHPFVQDADRPVVFHLHGHIDVPASLVLTEDDYLEFLKNLSRQSQHEVIPPQVQAALANTSLLFMGYSLKDINFRVLLRGVRDYVQRNPSKRTHLSIQLDLAADDEDWPLLRARDLKDPHRFARKLRRGLADPTTPLSTGFSNTTKQLLARYTIESDFLSLFRFLLDDINFSLQHRDFRTEPWFDQAALSSEADEMIQHTTSTVLRNRLILGSLYPDEIAPRPAYMRPPAETAMEIKRQQWQAKAYLEKYFHGLDTYLFWGSCPQFVAELRAKMEA